MMGFPMGYPVTSHTCENCGAKGQKEKKECQKCGYLKPTSKELEPGTLIYCEGCGCTYLQLVESASVCNLHPKSKQVRVHVMKPAK